MNPANIPAENPPTRKRGRPRKEKTPKPKRLRGRPRGIKPEVLDILFEFILSPEMRSGGRSSRKRALRAAAARVKIPLPTSIEAPPFPDLLTPVKFPFEGPLPLVFDTYENAKRALVAARSAAPTRSLTPEEQRKFIDSASRFLKATKASAAAQIIIPPGEYQLCAGCGEVLSGGDLCEVCSVLEVGTPVSVYVHPKSKEHPNCISAWHKSGDSQILDRLDLAAQLTPKDGDEGNLYLAQVDVPGVCTTTRGGGFEDPKTRRKKLEKLVKGECLRLYPEGPDPDLSYRRDEYGLDLPAQREANGGNTRMRASEGLSGIEGSSSDDEATDDAPMPTSLRSVAVGKNYVEDRFIEQLHDEKLGANAEEAAAISLKAREEKHPYGDEPRGRELSGLSSDDAAYSENLAAQETEKELRRRYWKDFSRIKEEFRDGLIDRAEKNRRIKKARAVRKEAEKRAEEERNESLRGGPRVESSDDGMWTERFDANAVLPTGLRPQRQKKVRGKGDFHSKFRGSYYERDTSDREGETPLYQNHRPHAPPGAFALRGTFSTYLLELGLLPPSDEMVTDKELEIRKRARLEWKDYQKKWTQRKYSELAIVSHGTGNAVAWWPWNPREAELKFTFSGKPSGDGFLFDKNVKAVLDKAAEYTRAQWTHKPCQQYDPGMVYEIDGITPVLGGQKPMPKKKFLARAAAEIVRMDGWFKRKFGGAYFLADLVSGAFRRERFFDSVEDSQSGVIRHVRRSISLDAVADTYKVRRSLPKPTRILKSPPRPEDREAHLFGKYERRNVGQVRHSVFVPVYCAGCGDYIVRYVFVEGIACREAAIRSPRESCCLFCANPSCVYDDADYSEVFSLLFI